MDNGFSSGMPLATAATNFTLFVAGSTVAPPGTNGSQQVVLSASKPCSLTVNQDACNTASCFERYVPGRQRGNSLASTIVSIPLTAHREGNGNYQLVLTPGPYGYR